MDQEPLFNPPKPVAPLRPLTERQASLYALICSVPGGVSAPELGALMHAGQGRHAPDDRCIDCGQDGARALREKGLRKRLVRRSGAVYEPRDENDRARPVASAQLEGLPGESFADIFGSEAA